MPVGTYNLFVKDPNLDIFLEHLRMLNDVVANKLSTGRAPVASANDSHALSLLRGAAAATATGAAGDVYSRGHVQVPAWKRSIRRRMNESRKAEDKGGCHASRPETAAQCRKPKHWQVKGLNGGQRQRSRFGSK